MRACAKVVPTILILTIFSFYLPCVRGSSGYVDVTVSEAKNMIESNPSLVILDVRTQSEYNSGHIKNAKLIPHTELEARIDELDENREILVYCHSGDISAIASQILVDHGFEGVYNMLGGILAWVNASYLVYVHYTSIQQAINNASDGDTIFISSGVYYEHLVINRSLTLVGENRKTTIIDGDSKGTAIYVKGTSNASIRGFTLQKSGCACKGYSGVSVEDSRNINITNNLIMENGFGINLDSSYEIIVTRNDIIGNSMGIAVRSCSGNVIYHNNFVDNVYAAYIPGGPDTWNDNYPSGGNYWSDYNSTDLFSGPHQNETGSDGIGDSPHVISWRDQDNYPLMGMLSDFKVIWEEQCYDISVISNSTVSHFDFKVTYELEIRKEISFNVTGKYNQIGFCRVMIPTELMNYSYTVLINGEEANVTLLGISNNFNAYLYFTYKLGTKRTVIIIPELPSTPALLLFTLVTWMVVVLIKFKYRRRKTRAMPFMCA